MSKPSDQLSESASASEHHESESGELCFTEADLENVFKKPHKIYRHTMKFADKVLDKEDDDDERTDYLIDAATPQPSSNLRCEEMDFLVNALLRKSQNPLASKSLLSSVIMDVGECAYGARNVFNGQRVAVILAVHCGLNSCDFYLTPKILKRARADVDRAYPTEEKEKEAKKSKKKESAEDKLEKIAKLLKI